MFGFLKARRILKDERKQAEVETVREEICNLQEQYGLLHAHLGRIHTRANGLKWLTDAELVKLEEEQHQQIAAMQARISERCAYLSQIV